MDTVINQTRLSLIQGDITRQTTEAIVNAANSSLMGGAGVDGAIHLAGGPAILKECRQIVMKQGPLPAGQAVITTGGNLQASYVIHTVGPIWHGGRAGERATLASAYRQSLQKAAEHKLKSVSFPSISTGAYRYPLDEAAGIALNTVAEFLQGESSLELVVFVLFNSITFAAYQQALKELVSRTTT